MKAWRNGSVSQLAEKAPSEGSSGPFQETRRLPSCVLWLFHIFMPGRNMSVGWSKLCHNTMPLGDRKIRFPVFISTITDPVVLDVGDGDEELAAVVVLVVQRIRPLTSDMTRLELSVRTREGVEEEMAGASRLATHTTVSRGMLLYHMPR
ncbi:unnamed protein product [Urochloa decumbens]|uniref:Uncharacterized protein n=1 Tax=Urochloa decumbens TaxID=240449 RepID=A0ABC9G477_9POAL